MNVHYFSSTSEAYDRSQTGYTPDAVIESEEYVALTRQLGETAGDSEAFAAVCDKLDAFQVQVADGDVLVVESEGVFGVMVEAWPTAVTEAHGAFHTVDPEVGWDGLDGGKYKASADKAWSLVEALHQADNLRWHREQEEAGGDIRLSHPQLSNAVHTAVVAVAEQLGVGNVEAVAHIAGWYGLTTDDGGLAEAAAEVDAPKSDPVAVRVFGPNLRDQRKGQFHVHAADCGDCAKYGRRGPLGGEGGEVIEVDSALDVSAYIYVDHLSDHGLEAGTPEADELLDSWLSDFWFAPCVKGLR